MIAAVIAVSSYVIPAVGSAINPCGDSNPARPAKAPENMYRVSLCDSTLIPDVRAAFSLSPMAKVYAHSGIGQNDMHDDS